MNAPVRIYSAHRSENIPFPQLDLSNPKARQDDARHFYFGIYAAKTPPLCSHQLIGPDWAVSKYQDIMHCAAHKEVFSCEIGGANRDRCPCAYRPEAQ